MTLGFDILLLGSLLWLAWRALAAPDLFKGVVLFIGFGLLLALAWVRLHAPDIALAEAAIGSGLTGALFLSALGRLNRMDREEGKTSAIFDLEPRGGPAMRWVIMLSFLAVTGILGWVVAGLPWEAAGLGDAVRARLADSGASNPVTAVLLNFRAYDTLLEIGVLLLAVVAVWAVARSDAQPATLTPKSITVPPQQTALVNLLAPVMVVVAGYLLWRGTSAPGGAFQSGAVLGGAGVLLLLSRPDWLARPEPRWLRAGLVLGLAVFLAVGVVALISGRRWLEYPSDWAGALILVIEAAATLSIGLTLTLLFLGGRPARQEKPNPS